MIKKNITVNLFIIMYKETRRWTLIYVQSISSDNDLIMVIVIDLIETTKIEFKNIKSTSKFNFSLKQNNIRAR